MVDPVDDPHPSVFPWYGLPARAQESRLAALRGAGVMLAITLTCYFVTNVIAGARGVTVFDPAQLFVIDGRTLDSRIPYVPWTLHVYKLYVWFLLLPVLLYPKTAAGARELFRLFNGLILITFVACTVFLLCPAEATLRATADAGGSSEAMQAMIRMLHEVDRPFNTWPSMHVALPGLVALVVTRWLRKRRWVVVLWVALAAMSISTLTIKQHFIWDAITGALLALVYWGWKWRITRSP